MTFIISGNTAGGTTVTLSGAASATTTANPITGAFSFSGLSAGSYTLTPSKTGYVFTPASSNQTISSSNITGLFFSVTPVGTSACTYNLQTVVDRIKGLGDLETQFDVGGFTLEPIFSCANDTINAIFATPFPNKFSEITLPTFYTNSYQQDYALLNTDGTSVTNVEWLERGIAINVQSTAIPKAWVNVECGRSLPQRTGVYTTGSNSGTSGNQFLVSSLPNESLYYGTWGAPNTGNATLGNNPVAGSVYTNPLTSNSQPANPITQIQDSNGNYLVLTTYGTTGVSAPSLPIGSAPGLTVTDGSCVWTAVDPLGMGIRILDVPSQTGVTWQFEVVGQSVPPIFTSLSQTLAPLPDKYEPVFRAGLIAALYQYSPIEKIRVKANDKWLMWLKSLESLRARQDRELEEYSFVPNRTVMSTRPRSNWRGPSNPYFPGLVS